MLFEIEEITELTIDIYDTPHRHEFYELFVIHGRGHHLIDFIDYKFDGNYIQLISPNQIHLLKRNSEASGFVLKFDTFFLESSKELLLFYNTVLFNQNFNPNKETSSLDKEILVNLFSKYKIDSNNQFLFLSLLSFLTNLFDTSIEKKEVDFDLFLEFVKSLEFNIKKERKVFFYINSLKVSSKELNKVVKKRTGMPTKEFIQKRLLLESKRLLYYSRLTVKEVAYELNFKEPAHFSNFFKKETGDYPLIFLNSLKFN